uniref:Protein-serine/threonine kinase n=1 Tax=Amorphochlora amoebiformis TaxID=1561963 RepID=A0A7S0DMG0_9EUKA|mmetsp:Transcript_3084/g.4715  ORF Transcript_3084/g.4715 Transcript_3084/m.4715 type:complete len:446 (+) Transcript_3084:22-1359(+)
MVVGIPTRSLRALPVAFTGPSRLRTALCRWYRIKRKSEMKDEGLKSGGKDTVTISRKRFEELLLAEATQMASVRQTSVSIELMRKFGKNPTLNTLIQSAEFLHRELPVRYAVRAKEFELAPSWIKTEPFKQISDMYIQCFLDLRSMDEPSTADSEERLCEILRNHKARLALVISLLSEGVTELRVKRGLTQREETFLHDLLDRFLSARIGTSVITAQHLALHDDVVNGNREGYVGALDLKCSPAEVLRDAAQTVQFMCEKEMGTSPGFVVKGHLDVTFPYFPAHIHYIGCELLKNSFRATVEHSKLFENDADFKIPDVEVVIGSSSQNEDVCIMIRDRGGGIPSHKLEDVWKYTHTTAGERAQEMYGYQNHRREGILAGMGFGLPLSRLYAGFFGGQLELGSLAGIGTAAYVRLKRLGGVEQIRQYEDRFPSLYNTFTPLNPFEG